MKNTSGNEKISRLLLTHCKKLSFFPKRRSNNRFDAYFFPTFLYKPVIDERFIQKNEYGKGTEKLKEEASGKDEE